MVPTMVQQLKSEGRNDESILEKIAEQQRESILNYGNRSKVGLLMHSHNRKLLSLQKVAQEQELKDRNNLRHTASNFNKAQMEELSKF